MRIHTLQLFNTTPHSYAFNHADSPTNTLWHFCSHTNDDAFFRQPNVDRLIIINIAPPPTNSTITRKPSARLPPSQPTEKSSCEGELVCTHPHGHGHLYKFVAF